MTPCEEIVYDVMLKNPGKRTVGNLRKLVNRTYGKRWSRKNVRTFLRRLVKAKEVKRSLLWFYEVNQEKNEE